MIGFVGAGLMGQAMIRNLLKAGYPVQVYTRTKEKAEAVLSEGALWKDSAKACAEGADFVITIVGYPKDVEEVYFGENGILAGASPGTVLMDMTTTSPQLSARICEAAKEKGVDALDAPVSGGLTGAINATLAIMVGGNEEAFKRAKPVFSALGKNIVYEGTAGAGQHTKMANQIAIAGALSGVCEALKYAKTAGLDPEKMFATIRTGAAGSFQMEATMPNLLQDNYDASFYMKHFIKDLGIAKEEMALRGTNLPILLQVLSLCEEVQADGHGDEGTQALYHFYEGE